ncbi:MAG: primosomal protein N', partial [Nitrospirae bacterium]
RWEEREGEGEAAPVEAAEGRRPTLTPEQAAALEALRAALGEAAPRPVLLHGVTGSGKTEVYLRLAEGVVAAGRQALILVPEIGLTPQVAAAFAGRFAGRVAIQHSGLAPGARRAQWRAIAAGRVPVVVGTRSAVFAPLERLGLVVVDEEHDPAYKQAEAPRYHGRDLAILRGVRAGALVVLGSATPSLESLHHARRGRYRRVVMRARATGRRLPPVHLVDMRTAPCRGLFSVRLLKAMEERLARGEQTLLFLNRRGYARAVQCTACGEAIGCPHCATALTYHRVDGTGRCHLCGYRATPSVACPACGAARLQLAGAGTQKVEERLHRLFPTARVVRMDRDTTRRTGAHRELLDHMHAGRADILLGTQIVTKGHHLGRLTLVGVLLGDAALQVPDFRAAERCFQLLSQVAGRCGREGPGEVLIQTYQPESPVLRAVAAHDYDRFADHELATREALRLPPFGHLVLLAAEAAAEAE